MVTGRQFRNDATETLVQSHLTVKTVGQQAALAVIQCNACLVAGCLDTQYTHLVETFMKIISRVPRDQGRLRAAIICQSDSD